MPRKEERTPRRWRGDNSAKSSLLPADAARLAALGIQPDSLAGRLRLVLTIGCYRDFRFTRDILSSGAARDQVEVALQALQDLGAHCDCEVLQAVGQPPLSVLWHNPPPTSARSGRFI